MRCGICHTSLTVRGYRMVEASSPYAPEAATPIFSILRKLCATSTRHA